jgi:hypothetical protein
MKQPLLRPGVRVVRRDDSYLQVGLGRDRVMLPDTPSARSLLAELARGQGPLPATLSALDETRRSCDKLLEANLLVEADTFWPDLARFDAAAVTAYSEDPASAHARLAARHGARLGLQVPAFWHRFVSQLCSSVSIPLAGSGEQPTLRLLITFAVHPRAVVDTLMRSGEPHLLISSAEGAITLGPFVDPGRTACLRCVDAHLSEFDPRRGLVLEQYADDRVRRSVPEPVDWSLVTLALGWAVRDLVTYLDGGTPATWSATAELTPDLNLTPQQWRRHPACGCSWNEIGKA